MEYETVIGLEVHIQLLTQSKAFSAAAASFCIKPNTEVDEASLGLAGALPVINSKVLRYAIMLGLATKCSIREVSRFARKHYFYPDLPKGYQISQFEEPICENGDLVIRYNGEERAIGIRRIHIEEDAGKNIHDKEGGVSLLDFNRVGVPLLEVVSEPDLSTPAEAAEYLRTLRQLVRYLAISDGNMEEGSLRCDANISLRPKGEKKFGVRTEIKNVNSFRFVEKALEYEVLRQRGILEEGGVVKQETRWFDSVTSKTYPLRSKEEAADYRYMIDPDLPPLKVSEEFISQVLAELPQLPQEYLELLTKEHGLSEYDAALLTSEKGIVRYYQDVVASCHNPKVACNWITGELFALLKKNGLEIEGSPISAAHLGELILLVERGEISGKTAKFVFEEMAQSGESPESIVTKKGLRQITNTLELQEIVQGVLEENPRQWAEYRAGSEKLLTFFIGLVLRACKGRANPEVVKKMLQDLAK